MNSITLTGTVQNAPEKKGQNENSPTTFRVRVFGGRKDKESGKWASDWFRCLAFGKTAERLEGVQVGHQVTLRGRMQNNPYTTKDGDKRDSWEVLVDEVESHGPRPEFATAAASSEAPVPW